MTIAQPLMEPLFRSSVGSRHCAPNRHLQNACLIGFDGTSFLVFADADKAVRLDRDKPKGIQP